MIQAVLFDLDGTLLNTLKSIANCYNRVLAANGYQTHEIEAFKYFIGNGGYQCLIRCLEASGESLQLTSNQIDELLRAQQADYQQNWQKDVNVYPGIVELLSRLKSSELKIAVLTNKDHGFAVQCIDYFFGQGTFDVVQGHSANIPHKPDPTGALHVASVLGVQAEDTLFVGDSAVDIQTANASHFTSVGVLWGFRERSELTEAGANHIIDSPTQLLQIL